MSVYVDDLVDYENRADLTPRMRRKWAHLTADTVDELHAFAARLGLKRSWYQERRRPALCHYDVTAGVRDKALRLGALPGNTADRWLETLREERERMSPPVNSEDCQASDWHHQMSHVVVQPRTGDRTDAGGEPRDG